MPAVWKRASTPFTKYPPEPRRTIIPMPPSAPKEQPTDTLPQPTRVKFATSGIVSGVELNALVQGILPRPVALTPSTDTWGGYVYANLGGEVFLGGAAGNDGTESPQGAISIFKGGVYKVCFAPSGAVEWNGNCDDSFTYEVPHAVVIWPSGTRLGLYTANTNIVKGTGKFKSASGHLSISGPFIVWPDSSSMFGASGRWNAEIKGSVCGVQ